VFAACYALPLLALGAWTRLPGDFLLRRSLTHLRQHRLLALREGVNETIAVVEYANLSRALYTNGHSMSATSPDAQRYMRAFSHVPLLLQERPRTAMVMCFGVGNTLHAALLHPLERVDLVDLSVDVLEHAGWFAETNGNALRDPRVRVFVNDGRQHLRMAPPGSYDLITGEPPPIAHAGVSALYSREFFELARSRLRPGGLISYWLPIRQVSSDAARSLVRAFVEVFPSSVLLSGAGSELILLGARDDAPRLDPERLRARLAALPAVTRDLHEIYLDRPQEFFSTFAASADTMRRASERALPLTDDRPALEYGAALYTRRAGLPPDLFDVGDAAGWCPACLAPRAEAGADGPESYRVQLAVTRQLYASPDFLLRRPGDLQRAPLAMPSGEAAAAEVGRSLFLRSLLRLAPSDYRRARALLEAGRLEEATRLLEEVVLLAPGNPKVRAALGQAYLAAGRREEARLQFDRALAIAPDLEEARAGLARLRASPPG
jgi:spermidine synthase